MKQTETSPQGAQTIRWLGMGMRVPCGWEIVRHAVSASKGHLFFVDRRHQRLAMYWTACESRPEESVLLESSRVRDEQQHPDGRFTAMPEVGAWRGHRWRDGQGSATRAARWDSLLKRWVEMVFSWPGEYDQDQEWAVLRSYEGTAGAHERRVQAFGIDVAAPEGFALESVVALPADVTVRYRARRVAAHVRCTRLASEWYHGSLESAARRDIKVTSPSTHQDAYAVHPASVVRGPEAAFSWRWLAGQRRRLESLAWHCPSADAVYQVRLEMSRGATVAPSAFSVMCCGAREAA